MLQGAALSGPRQVEDRRLLLLALPIRAVIVAPRGFFGLMLFVVELLVVGPRVRFQLASEPRGPIARMKIMHGLVPALSLLVIAAVVGGICGLL